MTTTEDVTRTMAVKLDALSEHIIDRGALDPGERIKSQVSRSHIHYLLHCRPRKKYGAWMLGSPIVASLNLSENVYM